MFEVVCRQKCVETLNQLGLKAYRQQYGDIPVPQGGKLLETMGAIRTTLATLYASYRNYVIAMTVLL